MADLLLRTASMTIPRSAERFVRECRGMLGVVRCVGQAILQQYTVWSPYVLGLFLILLAIGAARRDRRQPPSHGETWEARARRSPGGPFDGTTRSARSDGQGSDGRILKQTPRQSATATTGDEDDNGVVGMQTEKRVFVRDVLYGYIELFPLARMIIDTPVFQGLRDLRQLGLASYVFPSATHTRFEHSLGVFHLTGVLLHAIAERQPDVFPKDPAKRRRLIELAQIAGLCHDIGHYAFSHTFDSQMAHRLGLPEHEERGAQMFRDLVAEHRLPVTPDEVEFVINLMLGNGKVRPGWMAGIIHDREAQLDVDKLDYLNRDSFQLGFGRPIQIERIFLFARVLRVRPSRQLCDQRDSKSNSHPGTAAIGKAPDTEVVDHEQHGATEDDDEEHLRLCFHRKILLQLLDVYQARYRLFLEVYRHRVVVGLDELVGDLLRCIEPVLRFWIARGLRPTDSLLATLPHWLALPRGHLPLDGVKPRSIAPTSSCPEAIKPCPIASRDEGSMNSAVQTVGGYPPGVVPPPVHSASEEISPGGEHARRRLSAPELCEPTGQEPSKTQQHQSNEQQPLLTEAEEKRALELWTRLRSRKLYGMRRTEDISHADVRVRIGLSALDADPIERLWFYDDRGSVRRMSVRDVSKLLGNAQRLASETIAFRIERNQTPETS